MDYTVSLNNVLDAGTGFRRHEDNQALPTVLSEKDINSVIWELMEVIRAGGIVPAQFDEAIPASYNAVLRAVRRFAGRSTIQVSAANSPFLLTAEHCGLVGINASAGPVVITLPAAVGLNGLPLDYDFCRVDGSVNTCTVNKSAIALNVDTIDGAASFTLAGQFSSRSIRCDGGALWVTLAQSNPIAPAGARVARITSTGNFVAPIAGTYFFSATAGGGSGASGGPTGGSAQIYGGSGGGGGGAGQSVVKQPFVLTAGQVVGCTLGSGGASVAGTASGNGNPGATGGNCVIGALITLLGGSGGAPGAGANGTSPTGGGAGGAGFPAGQPGSDSAYAGNGGNGGTGPFGGAGNGSRAGSGGTNSGGAAFGFGCGGAGSGGSYGAVAGSSGASGAGAPALVIVEW